MRPIEFKAQNVNGVWVCGNFSILKKKIGNVDAGSYISNSAGEPFAYKVRPETVSQFTGLKDKNGKKIFEGDIVAFSEDDFHVFNSQVEYFSEDGYPAFDIKVPSDYYFDSNVFSEVSMSGLHEIEVIGNIHENPELMEGTE
ncbi:YopX family protein [Listeria monocytogenes]